MTPPADRIAIDPTRESFKGLFHQVPAETPVVMLNLLAFKETAADAPGVPARTGRAAYAAYTEGVLPLLAEVGARVVWSGDAHHPLVAPEGESWDEVLLVEYPTRDAFAQLIRSPAYAAILHHRTAALRDARLVATTVRR